VARAQDVSGPTPRFAAVIFDLYGTLVHEFPRAEFYGAVQGMAAALGADPKAFRGAWDATAIGRQTGAFLDMEANVRAICAELGLNASPAALKEALGVRRAMYDWWFHPREGALEMLREVRARRYPVGLLSMCAPDTPELWRGSPLASLVDVTVFSSEVGLRKPDPAIYRLAAARLAVAPQACCYCGDGSYGELSGAEAVGMTAYLIRDPSLDVAAQLRPQAEEWAGATVPDLRDLLAILPPLTAPA
jgi:putative hydrolase of the HAD superfamily